MIVEELIVPALFSKSISSFGLPSRGNIIEGISPLCLYPLFESIDVTEGVLLFGGGIIEWVLMSTLELCHWTNV